MTSTVPVMCTDGAYAAAVAELPLRTHRSSDAVGAVVVVSGQGNWCDEVRRNAAGGARAVVVSHPCVVPSAEIRRLAAEVGDIPVILQRQLLRSDAASDAARAVAEGVEPRLVTIDGAALAFDLGVVLRDAVAWARVLTGGALGWNAASGGLVLAEPSGTDGPPAALNVVAVDGGGSWIRGHALGEVRSVVEASAGRTVVSTTGAAGRVIAPTHFETPQRLALRRALDALTGAEPSMDLADLAHDAALAEELTSERPL